MHTASGIHRGDPATLIAVVVSADIEWEAVRSYFHTIVPNRYPFGEWFSADISKDDGSNPIIVSIFHGGWGKISAAASLQYIISTFNPEFVINLGTCGGFEGLIERGAIILANRVVVYDIDEAMGDQADHIAHYATDLDLTWIGDECPHDVVRTGLVSGDRDLRPADILLLHKRYGAIAGDWESGSIAWVADRNKVPCLILRGVTDLVSSEGGEAYDGNIDVYVENSRMVIRHLLHYLPAWIDLFYNGREERV